MLDSTNIGESKPTQTTSRSFPFGDEHFPLALGGDDNDTRGHLEDSSHTIPWAESGL